MLSIDDVHAAATRLAGVANRTPVITSRTLDDRLGARVFLKAESFQRIGAFKFRGAYNAIAALSADERARGVCTASSGNHAQAVALAARLHDIAATILMPIDAPAAKRAAVEGYGAEVVEFDRYHDDREQLLRDLSADRGLPIVHPYEDERVMAGQGTATLELLADHPDLDLVAAPVGGGGLLAGTATAAAALRPGIEIFGVEPEASDDTARSLAAGERVRIPFPRTIADGQQLEIPGERTFAIVSRLATGVVTVADDEIVRAMAFAFERLKLVLEPSGATALAALLEGRLPAAGRRVGVILSGGNVDLGRFAHLLGATDT